METSQKQTSPGTQGKLTFSQEDFLASHTAVQESDLERKMTATSGLRCCEQFERFNRAGSWAKTFAALLIGMEGWYSTKCRLTWKMRATKSHRIYFQLAPSTLPTDGIGFGLLPTVLSSRTNNENQKSEGFGMSLMHSAMLLPTPRKQSANSPAEHGQGGKDLQTYVRDNLLPTPTKRDFKGARSSEALEAAGRTATNSLPDAFAQTGKTSQLNPQFVAEMMGFPTDWLELPFQSTEKSQ